MSRAGSLIAELQGAKRPKGCSMSLTHSHLVDILKYDPETGVFRWRISKGRRVQAGEVAGCDRDGYRQIKIDGTAYRAHRLAWFYVNRVWPTDQIDHENLDKADNRFANLREATPQQNGANRSANKNTITGLKGVSRVGVRFVANIRVGYVGRYLGSFGTSDDARAAYAKAATEAFGDFART